MNGYAALCQISEAIAETRARRPCSKWEVARVIVNPETWTALAAEMPKMALHVSADQARDAAALKISELHIYGVPVIANRRLVPEDYVIEMAKTERFSA